MIAYNFINIYFKNNQQPITVYILSLILRNLTDFIYSYDRKAGFYPTRITDMHN